MEVVKMINYEQKIKNGGYQRIVNVVENILLRPNNTKLMLGEEKFNSITKAVENILEENYKQDEIYKYYYELNNHDHGFCTFERWKLGMLF